MNEQFAKDFQRIFTPGSSEFEQSMSKMVGDYIEANSTSRDCFERLEPEPYEPGRKELGIAYTLPRRGGSPELLVEHDGRSPKTFEMACFPTFRYRQMRHWFNSPEKLIENTIARPILKEEEIRSYDLIYKATKNSGNTDHAHMVNPKDVVKRIVDLTRNETLPDPVDRIVMNPSNYDHIRTIAEREKDKAWKFLPKETDPVYESRFVSSRNVAQLHALGRIIQIDVSYGLHLTEDATKDLNGILFMNSNHKGGTFTLQFGPIVQAVNNFAKLSSGMLAFVELSIVPSGSNIFILTTSECISDYYEKMREVEWS